MPVRVATPFFRGHVVEKREPHNYVGWGNPNLPPGFWQKQFLSSFDSLS